MYKVAASTMGQENRAERAEGLTYYHKGDPARTPGSRHFEGFTPEPKRKANSDNTKRSTARQERIARFAALLEQGMTEEEARAEMGITRQTAGRYAREIRKQQEAS